MMSRGRSRPKKKNYKVEILMSIFFQFSSTVTAAITRVEPPRKRRAESHQLFRTILNNLNGHSLRLLIWDEDIAKYQGKINRQIIILYFIV